MDIDLTRAAHIRLSSQLASAIGRPWVEVHLPAAATATDVLAALGSHFPTTAPLLRSALVIATDRVLGPDDPVPAGAEVALLHPVAGG